MGDKKNNANNATGNDMQFHTRPPVLGKWESFHLFLWNSETGQFLGRTAGSWGKILLFYVIFYAVLTAFFAAMLAVFFQTLDMQVPKWQLDRSLIGTNPGLGFRPMPPSSNVESTLIWYKAGDPENINHWAGELDSFLHLYDKNNNPQKDKLETCPPFGKPTPGKVCDVSIEDERQWHPCTRKNRYNYNNTKESQGGPCIFLKLNRIYNWEPDYYNHTTLNQTNMKPYLRKSVETKMKEGKEKTVWVTCEGENAADIEHIGPIRYIPDMGFPSEYFPYKNQEGYLSPLVAVHFERPTRNVLINIECKAWARNIIHDRADKRGSVHFELMVD